MKQCAVLVINVDGRKTPHRVALEKAGFRVLETCEWPDDGVVGAFQVVVVLLRQVETLSMLGARLRAKAHFGRRVLIAVVPGETSATQRRCGVDSGFDDVVQEAPESRVLLARILRQLRARPEYRCFLPDPKRRAA